jgi:hypothetical protein
MPPCAHVEMIFPRMTKINRRCKYANKSIVSAANDAISLKESEKLCILAVSPIDISPR